MATLDADRIAAVVIATTPLRGERAATAVAIALAESGGRTDAAGDGGLSHGLWQIYQPAHPGVTVKCAEKPTCAARQMYYISNLGVNFNPWTVYWSRDGGQTRAGAGKGSYRNYYDQALKAVRIMEANKENAKSAADQSDIASATPGEVFGGKYGGVADISGPIDAVIGAGKAVVSLGEFLGKLSDRNTWIRIGEIIGGIVMMVIALRILAQRTRVAAR